MKKIIILTSLLFTFYYNCAAQNQPTLQTTQDWIFNKVKLYAKRVGPPRETSDIFNIIQERNVNNEPVWSFTSGSGKLHFWIYPLRITSYEILSNGVEFNGTNVLAAHYLHDDGEWNDDYTTRYDHAVIALDMNMEENFSNRMTKALDTFILLKKKKASSNEAF